MDIYLDSPNLGDLEKTYLNKCIDSGFISTYGPYVREFENRFSRYLNIGNAVAVQSGTAGIHTALYELGIKQGDEVILPALTFVATANAARYVGAKPVFVDVDLDTWNISPQALEAAITQKTKAVIPVHLYGNPCPMNQIQEIADRYGLYIIEDATESLGARYQGKYTGTFGNFGVFSFNGNKVITTGGGGMIIGRNHSQTEHIRYLVNQARDEDKGYYHSEIGFNYRLTNLEAALGLAQLERLPHFLEKKLRYRAVYEFVFSGPEEIVFQRECPGGQSMWWLPSITIDTIKINLSIEKIQKILKKQGVPTRRIFAPITEFPPYRDKDKSKYRHAYHIYENGLNLPGSTLNNEAAVEYAALTLLGILQQSGANKTMELFIQERKSYLREENHDDIRL